MRDDCGLCPKDSLHLIESIFCQMDHRPEGGWRMTHFDGFRCPEIDVYRHQGVGSIGSMRTRRHIDSDGNRDFFLALSLSERSTVLQAGANTVSEPGTFRLYSASVPFLTSLSGIDTHAPYLGLHARLSGPLIRQLLPSIDSTPNAVFKIRPGAGRLMQSMLEAGLAEAHAFSLAQARDFGRLAIQAIANAALDAPESPVRSTVAMPTSLARVREAALDFIALKISDPSLTCRCIAEHCRVSETYLHAAFAAVGMKVGTYVRETRLQHCRAELRNPALARYSISQIMMKWGFVDASAFGRTYRHRFGMAPRDDRTSNG